MAILRASGFKSQSDFNWDNRVYIGHSAYAGQPYFQGTMDDVAIWNTALTAAQVQALAQGRSPLTTDSLIGTNVKAAMYNVNSSAYVRIPFTVSSPADVQLLRLNMKYDDGYVAWLNGVEIARRNAPATLAYNSTATAARSEGECLTAEEIEWTDRRRGVAFRHEYPGDSRADHRQIGGGVPRSAGVAPNSTRPRPLHARADAGPPQ